MKNKVAVLGQYGIEKYSLSPIIHNTFFEENNINGEYFAIPVLQDNLNKMLSDLQNDGYVGVNLTIPHKINAIKYLDDIDNSAQVIGAINTILFKKNKMIGYNTDAFGFIENLNKKINNWKLNNKALIIGAGGASRAALYGLKVNKIQDIIVVNRTLERAKELAKEFDIDFNSFDNIQKILKDRNLVVNTTSMGMNNLNNLKIDFSYINKNTIVYDIVYTPLITEFLKSAQNNNLRIVDGLGMLLLQAAKAFKIWFDIYPNISNDLINQCVNKLNENN